MTPYRDRAYQLSGFFLRLIGSGFFGKCRSPIQANAARWLATFSTEGFLTSVHHWPNQLNFGSNSGHSHRLEFEPAFEGIMAAAHEYSYVLDGRFKGGYITRTYGQPWEGVHALQLELSQETYMDEELNTYDQEKAIKTAALLERLVLSFMDMHPY